MSGRASPGLVWHNMEGKTKAKFSNLKHIDIFRPKTPDDYEVCELELEDDRRTNICSSEVSVQNKFTWFVGVKFPWKYIL